ncbi:MULTISPECIES: RecQ family ATP-dependent DNA helicase [Pseudoalteromonas]|uniref:ATP-dependent DNA helicase RecQ n=1 Tax=Pseudoalteromonas amylolytica TaxID=1859457 RepID=A0A1S1MPH0_9GAMM|nr:MULTISPECIES: RecQ family ATP-dependent DNA helicase [Pseudoalteromonas]OHU84354.1 recombinase RecQ [Pseudoalteromonas sp. JW3]OHU87107.1 recombinase RecQ [Pseudoalteromonas amylolytica]
MEHGQQLLESLSQHFGFASFRPGQAQTISHLLAGHSSLAIFPTGSGKSLCYQLTALHLPHLTLVVSPLLALMQDQVAFLQGKGVGAATLDSSQSTEQSQAVMQGVRKGDIKILMVSVERFKNERFREFINGINVSMLVVDEAHCISEWGHNFRPDYLKLPDYRRELNIPLVLLLTATATKKVKFDMAKRFDISPQHIVQTGFYRPNLDLSVLSVTEQDKLAQLVRLIRAQQGAGIVYVTLQQQAQQVAKQLQAAGVKAEAYHAGLDDEVRRNVQQRFMDNQIQVVVATIAFGMGVDKSDIRFVIHHDLPKSIENYSQEIGRAGRDAQSAYCTVLGNLDSVATVENFVYGDTPERSGIEYVITQCLQEQTAGKWELQELPLSKASNIRLLALKTLLVQLEIQGAITAKYAYYADFRLKFVTPQGKLLSRFDPTRQAFLKQIFDHTQFKKVWGTLDMQALVASGADRQRVVAALDYLHEQGLIELESKRLVQVYDVNTQVLSQPELVDNLYRYFKDKEQAEIKRIAAMLRFFELDRCLSANLAYYFDDHQVPESCGHCSVCRAQAVKLSLSKAPEVPLDDALRNYVFAMQKHLRQGGVQASKETVIRFLAGVTTPFISQYKLKQLPGFACCEGLRFTQITDKVQQLALCASES